MTQPVGMLWHTSKRKDYVSFAFRVWFSAYLPNRPVEG